MENYLDAYGKRMQRNNDQLLDLAKEVMLRDASIEVYITKSTHRRYQSGITFIKGETINAIQFHEVPYRWSGCGIKEHGGGENISMPFDAEDVLKSFVPITTQMKTCKEAFKDRAQYLAWYTFLIPLTF